MSVIGRTVVIDNGSGYLKAGFGGDNEPNTVFPSIAAKLHGLLIGMNMKRYYVGYEAYSKRGILRLRNPIVNGIVNDLDWDFLVKSSITFISSLRFTYQFNSYIIKGNNMESYIQWGIKNWCDKSYSFNDRISIKYKK